MHLVTKHIASSPRQHDDIAALEGANGQISFLDFKNAASLNHDQEGDILAVWCGGVSPQGVVKVWMPVISPWRRIVSSTSCRTSMAIRQSPLVEISGRMSRRSGRIRCDSSISPCYTIAQEHNNVYP